MPHNIDANQSMLLSDETDHYRMYHPQMGEVKVAKSGLDDNGHKFIKSLPHFDDGSPPISGDNPEDYGQPSSGISSEPVSQPAKKSTEAENDKFQDDMEDIIAQEERDEATKNTYERMKVAPRAQQNISQDEENKSSELKQMGGKPSAPVMDYVAAPTAPQQQRTPSDQAQSLGVPDYEKTIKAQQDINTQAGNLAAGLQKNTATELAADAQRQQQLHLDTEARAKVYNDASDQLRTEIGSGKIDPQHFWSNKPLWYKLGSAISVALSGFGAGMTHTENGALKIIQKQIDDDIESQKANLNNKQSLLSKNLEATKNLYTAEAMTRAQMTAATQARISQMAAATGGQQQLLQSQLLNAQLQSQLVNHNYEVAGAVTGLKSKMGGLPENSAEDQRLMIQDPKYSQNRFPINGTAYVARNEDAAKELQKTEPIFKEVESGLMELKKIGPEAIVSPENKARAAAIGARITMGLAKLSGFARYSELTKEGAEKQFNDPSKLKSLLVGNSTTNDTLKAILQQREDQRAEALSGYKPLNLNQKSGYTPSK